MWVLFHASYLNALDLQNYNIYSVRGSLNNLNTLYVQGKSRASFMRAHLWMQQERNWQRYLAETHAQSFYMTSNTNLKVGI